MTAHFLDPVDTGPPPVEEALLTVLATRSPRGICLRVRGEVDSVSAPDLRARLEEALTSDAAEVVVDLTGVEFLDSAGLCALAVARRQAVSTGTRLRVLAATRAVVRPLQVTGLWDLLDAELVVGHQPA